MENAKDAEKKQKNLEKMKKYKITFCSDYPYSDFVIITAKNKKDVWKKFEKDHTKDWSCSIEEIE